MVRFDALPDRPLAGAVTEIAAAADQMTGTYRVEVAVSGAAGLASGLVGQVEIRPRAARPVALVPVEAVLEADRPPPIVFPLSADGRRAGRRAGTISLPVGGRRPLVGG